MTHPDPRGGSDVSYAVSHTKYVSARRINSESSPPAFQASNPAAPPPSTPASHLLRHPALPSTVLNFASYSLWTLYNKHLYAQHPGLPLFSTAFQMLLVAAACQVMLYLRLIPHEVPSRTMLKTSLIPLSVVRSSDLAFANASLALMSVAGQQILKSTIPVWVCLFSATYLRHTVPLRAWLIVAVIVAGTATATVGDPDIRSTPWGVASMMLSCFCRAGKCVINAKLLQGSLDGARSERIDKMTVLRYEAPMSGALILLSSIIFEGPRMVALLSSSEVWYFVIGNCLNAILMFFNQLSYLSIVELTSPIASQVLMNIKMIFLIVISTAFYPIHLSLVNGMGMVLAAGGAIAYSNVRTEAPRKDACLV